MLARAPSWEDEPPSAPIAITVEMWDLLWEGRLRLPHFLSPAEWSWFGNLGISHDFCSWCWSPPGLWWCCCVLGQLPFLPEFMPRGHPLKVDCAHPLGLMVLVCLGPWACGVLSRDMGDLIVIKEPGGGMSFIPPAFSSLFQFVSIFFPQGVAQLHSL